MIKYNQLMKKRQITLPGKKIEKAALPTLSSQVSQMSSMQLDEEIKLFQEARNY